jgi:hypothetical protein
MSLRIRRGTESQRTGVTFDTGEILWTTDGQQLWVGDGVTQGGKPAVGLNVAGYGLTFNTSSKKLEVSGLTADDIAGGVNNKFFSTELAQDAVAPMFTSGTHTNISFQYDDELGRMNATVVLDGVGISDISADTSPTLGGNLDLDGKSIGNIGVGNDEPTIGSINLDGGITATNVLSNTATINTINTGTTTIDQTNALRVTGVSNLFTVERTGLKITSNTTDTFGGLYIYGATSGDSLTSSTINMFVSKGTVASPVIVANNDVLGANSILAYNGFDYVNSAGSGFFVDGTPTSGAVSVPTRFAVAVSDGVGAVGSIAMTLNSKGVFSAPIMQPGSYTTTQRDELVPAVGMMIYNTTDNKFQGYQNSGGILPEWVDLS